MGDTHDKVVGQNDGGANNFYRIPEDVRTLGELFKYLNLDIVDIDVFKKAWEYRGNRDIGFNFHRFPEWVTDVDTLNEWIGESFYFGNLLKTFWINRGIRHMGTSRQRELNKRSHYYKRLVERHERLIKEGEPDEY